MKKILLLSLTTLLLQSCSDVVSKDESSLKTSPDASSEIYYTDEDFGSVRKIDAHVHANVQSSIFLEAARSSNFEILSINVDYPDFPPIDLQADIAQNMHAQDPQRFHFAATFSMNEFGDENWTNGVNRRIDDAVTLGASAVKVWKNIGMVDRDAAGERIFLNDERFDGVMTHLVQNDIPLIAHQGEPKNCWLPLDEMTTNNDRLYFSSHPEYYMHLHPEEPRYEELMSIRDEVVGRHPDLSVIGAHLASLEWSVDEIAKFLDAYPNATVDMAARMSEIQNQANQDHDRVRNFFIKYQDRILYGSDLTHNPQTAEMREQNPPVADDFAAQAESVWRADWQFLVTDKSQFVYALQADSKGLKLPRNVVDKIYYDNAARIFNLTNLSEVP